MLSKRGLFFILTFSPLEVNSFVHLNFQSFLGDFCSNEIITENDV